MKHRPLEFILILLSALCAPVVLEAAPPPTVDDVGDVESFGRAALYMGAKSGFVTVSLDPCPPPPTPPDPTTQCFQLAPAPATTSFSAENIATIRLPKKATRSIIYPALNFFVNYQLENTTGVPQPQGLFTFVAQLTIESDVLLDPSIIDPATGLPANGKLIGQFTYRYRDDRSMDTNDRQRTQITLVRVGNAGINKFQLIGQGLAPSVVDELFKKPMTIHMSISGNAKLVTDGNVTGNMRLFGD